MFDPTLRLFVDDKHIQRQANLQRILNRPRRFDQPVLKADRPWEGGRVQAWGSVIQEPDGLLRIWYLGIPNDRPLGWDRITFCYAESRDGFHWEKPTLGLHAWNGSTANNLFYSFGDDKVTSLALRGQGLMTYDKQGNPLFAVNNMDGMTVVRDDDEIDPQKRYKMVANMQDHRMWALDYPNLYPGITKEQCQAAKKTWVQCLDTSPDGIHWPQKPTVLVEAKYGDYMMLARDHRNKQWWLNQRPPSKTGRAAGMRLGKDVYSFSEPPEPIFVPDEESNFGKSFEWHGGLTPFNYADLDIGFLEKWSNTGTGDTCELAIHRDGEPWKRVMPRETFLGVGPEGSFDRCLVFPAHNAPIRIGDRLFIYYTGGGPGHRDRHDYSAAIGVMTLGADRFAGMANARRASGDIVTQPLTVEADHLTINSEPGLWGLGVRVAVLDETDAPIPGFTLEDCPPISADGVRLAVRWKTHENISSLRNKRIKLRFDICGATLYAFRIAD